MTLKIKLNSITYAMKAESLLKSKGINSTVLKTSNPKKGEGCGYALKISNADEKTLLFLKENGVDIKETVWENDIF